MECFKPIRLFTCSTRYCVHDVIHGVRLPKHNDVTILNLSAILKGCNHSFLSAFLNAMTSLSVKLYSLSSDLLKYCGSSCIRYLNSIKLSPFKDENLTKQKVVRNVSLPRYEVKDGLSSISCRQLSSISCLVC